MRQRLCSNGELWRKGHDMTTSNYDITRDKMRTEFLRYDQQRMISKYGLDHDDDYLYVDFTGHTYRIGRNTGIVEWSDDDFHTVQEGDFNESMILYDILCYAKDDCSLAGTYCMVNSLKGVVHSSGLGDSFYQKQAQKYGGHTDELKKACSVLGERIPMNGDVAAKLYPFSFLPVILQFWEADDEFPANLKFMFDENVLQYMHYETLYYLMGHLVNRINELM